MGLEKGRNVMFEDDIKLIDEWFTEKRETNFGTYHITDKVLHNDEYVVDSLDVEEFSEFLKKNFPDLVGIQCLVGTDGIWFWSKNLRDAVFL